MINYSREVKITFENKEGFESFKISDSHNSEKIFRKIMPIDSIEIYETVIAIFLNNNSESIGWFKVSQGGINGSVVDVRMIFSAALNCLATQFILCHNHPSGSLKPSIQDIAITDKLKEGSKVLDIKLLDHIILTKDSYFSFADKGLI